MGKKLFSEVTELTGLPEDLIAKELKDLLDKKGVEPEQMTIESLREALADYLTQVNIQMEAESEASEKSALSAAILEAAFSRSTKALTQ